MKTRTFDFAFVLVLLLMVFAIMGIVAPYGVASTPDTLSYLDLANNIKAGHGFLATSDSLPDSPDSAYVVQRSWPPLYPALLSLIVIDNFDVKSVVFMSGMLLMASSLLVYGILLGAGRLLASGGTLVFCVSSPVISIYTFGWSETLFLPLLLLSLWGAFGFLERSKTLSARYGFLLLMTLALVGLVYTRYLGLVFAGLYVVLFVHEFRRPSQIIALLASVSTFVIASGVFLFDNMTKTGHFSGQSRSGGGYALGNVMGDTAQAIVSIFPPLWMVVLLAGLAICFGYIASRRVLDAEPDFWLSSSSENFRRAIILLVNAVAYLVMLVLLSVFSKFDALDVRLISPFFVLFLLSAVLMLSAVPAKTVRVCASIFLLLVVAIGGLFQLLDTKLGWVVDENPKRRVKEGVFYNNFTVSDSTAEYRKGLFGNLVGDSGVIYAENPQFWRFVSRQEAYLRPSVIDRDFVQKIASKPGNLVVFSKQEWDQISHIKSQAFVGASTIALGGFVILKF